MGLLTKEQILAAADSRAEEVDVPEWGGRVRVRSVTGADRDSYEQWLVGNRTADKSVNIRNLRARMVAMCVVGEDGQRLFTDDDIEQLGQKDARALDRVFEVAQRVNGIGEAEVEALAKNS